MNAPHADMNAPPDRGLRIFWMMAAFVLLGIPFVAVLWESLNHILALDFSPDLWIALPAALFLGIVLYALAVALGRAFSS